MHTSPRGTISSMEPYTHEVLTASGRSFSIHKDLASAEESASIVGGTIRPFVLNPTTYWEGPASDHLSH